MATSEEVARLAGVSRATVSRALNGSPRISTETKKRVQDAIAVLGYEPDVVAQSLVRQRSRTLALSFSNDEQSAFARVAQTQHYFYLDMLKFIEQETAAAHYDLLLPSRPYSSTPEGYVRSLRMRHIAGVLALSVNPADPHIQALLQSDIPALFFDSIGQGSCASYVKSDNHGGALQAAEHLLQLGHRCIAIFPGSTEDMVSKERLSGYQQALAQAGISPEAGLIRASGWNTEEAYHATLALLAQRRDFTAVLAASDLMAIGMLRALHKCAIRVPEDVSLVGFDDVDLARYTQPPLTTVRQNRLKMAQCGVRQLLALIEHKADVAPVSLPTSLVVRGSTGPVRRSE